MYVSISAYNDADLLEGCLTSIRDVLPDARIDVVDGKYESWPEGDDNSTDATPTLAREHGANYYAAGPFHRECDKHEHRVALAPDGELALFIDADERLLKFDPDALPRATAIQPRIANALVYGPKSVYWPRIFKPNWVQSINRWDSYLFDVECERSDAVTIVHRHDLRDRSYREAKYDRFEAEGRTGRYEDAFTTYLEDEWDADLETCPECGRESVSRTQLTQYGSTVAEFSAVETCVAGDRCHAAIREYSIENEYRYLPDDWQRGFEEDRERLRAELIDAGCPFVGTTTASNLDRMRPAICIWINEHLGDAEREVFA
jgi:hypothetical protein